MAYVFLFLLNQFNRLFIVCGYMLDMLFHVIANANRKVDDNNPKMKLNSYVH